MSGSRGSGWGRYVRGRSRRRGSETGGCGRNGSGMGGSGKGVARRWVEGMEGEKMDEGWKKKG